MILYREIFLSVWHLIVIGLTLFAFVVMIIGGYSKKQVIKTTIQSALVFYLIVSFFIGYITYDDEMMRRDMFERLDETYEAQGETQLLVANLGQQINDNAHATIKVYAGNYHESKTFQGVLRIIVLYEDNTEEEKEFDVSIEPGEKLEVDNYFSIEQFKNYKYRFEPE
ncbi:hypothetical protein ACLIBG_08050 [Virgibacillus sp. W0181]|uniref:hypothetical protein n=1 Tax=Virgibacillus sp. W0181 TaxID=3391581 RepID=UPI003F45C237